MFSAPTLPRKKNLSSEKLSPQKKNGGEIQADERNIKNKGPKPLNADNFISDGVEELPPPPLPRKPQIQDPLGAFPNDQTKNNLVHNATKYQSLDTRAFNTSKFAVAASSDDSSPPSSLSAESTNSDDTKATNGKTKYLGAIPKRKSENITNSHRDGLHGMAKHMKRNKTPR